jgi:hypothetical protein
MDGDHLTQRRGRSLLQATTSAAQAAATAAASTTSSNGTAHPHKFGTPVKRSTSNQRRGNQLSSCFKPLLHLPINLLGPQNEILNTFRNRSHSTVYKSSPTSSPLPPTLQMLCSYVYVLLAFPLLLTSPLQQPLSGLGEMSGGEERWGSNGLDL